MPWKARDVKAALTRKFGFSLQSQGRSNRHEWFAKDVPGVPRVLTMFSHGMVDLSDSLLGKIARQLRVRRSDLDAMVGCTQSLEDYTRRLREAADGTRRGS